MSSPTRLLDFQFGLHGNLNDFTTAPSTYRRIQLVGGGESLMPRELVAIDRNDIAALDGRGFAHINGPLNVDDIAPVTEFKGVNSNTGTAVTATGWLDKMEQGELMTSLFGSLPIATLLAPTVAASGHTSTTLTFATATPVVGELILFPTNLGPRIRQVSSVAGLIATFERPYTGTPTSAQPIIRAARWEWSPALPNHLHGGCLAESPDVLASFLGCAPVSWALAMPTGGKLMATWGFAPTDVDGFLAPLSPATTYPAAGAPIIALNSELFIGSERFFVDDLTLNYTTGNEPRTTPSSENGRMGGIAAQKRAGFTMTGVIRNELAARGGVQRDTGTETLRTLLGDVAGPGAVAAERDVLLTIGRTAGAAMAVRMPNAQLFTTMAAVGSVVGVAFTATATRSASVGIF